MTLDEHITGHFGEDQGDDDLCQNCKFSDNRASKEGWLYCVTQYAYVEPENVCETHERMGTPQPPTCPVCDGPTDREHRPCVECEQENAERIAEGER